jgi:Bacterial SH3 domain
MNSRVSIHARLLTSLLAGIFTLLMVAKAPAEEFKPSATIASVNLRKAPRIDGEILALIPMGTIVEVGDCRDGWCRVSWNGQDGAVGRNLSTAAILRWPNVPVAARSSDRGLSQKTAKAARDQEEGAAEHSFILEIGTAGEWPLNGERPNFGGTIAGEIEPMRRKLHPAGRGSKIGDSARLVRLGARER